MLASASTRRRCSPQAIQDRLVANGGALGEMGAERRGREASPSVPPSSPLGDANFWARGYDQFGSGSGASAGVGYDINRAAPLIGGIDWRFGNGIVSGVAATYVATSASFKDGSRTNVSSYQGAAYAGWAGGPVVCLGKRGRELQRFRHLAASHALRAPRRRDLDTLRAKLSGPCGGRLPLGASGRRRERLRHALRRVGLCERAYRRASTRRAASARSR